MTTGKAYQKEDAETFLKDIEVFQEGGTRLLLEPGRPCVRGEIAIRVKIDKDKDEENLKQFYFSNEYNVL